MDNFAFLLVLESKLLLYNSFPSYELIEIHFSVSELSKVTGSWPKSPLTLCSLPATPSLPPPPPHGFVQFC